MEDQIKVVFAGKEFSFDRKKVLAGFEGKDFAEVNVWLFKTLSNLAKEYAFWENLRCQIHKDEETKKSNYKQWLIKQKQTVDTKRYLSEMAKEDAAIAQDINKYSELQKEIIDLTYLHDVVRTIVRSIEIYNNNLLVLKR